MRSAKLSLATLSIRGPMLALMLATLMAGCGGQARALVRSSGDLGKAVRRGDREAIDEGVLPATRSRIDYEQLLADTGEWSSRLARPTGARPEALIFLANDDREQLKNIHQRLEALKQELKQKVRMRR